MVSKRDIRWNGGILLLRIRAMNELPIALDPSIELLSPCPPKTHTSSTVSTQIPSFKIPEGAKTVGNYLLGKNIGQGSFGKVHLAMHLPSRQRVAIKIVQKTRLKPKDILRIRSETNILSTARHRNILQLLEIIETEKSILLVTEYLPGGELFKCIVREKRLSELESCGYFQQVVAGLEYLHGCGVAHRDLKPQNLLFDETKTLKIIDFGLSATYAGCRELKTFCGSPCYAAPEMIAAAGSYKPLLVDIWSLGVVLFAMLTGHLPFCDPDTHTLYRKILGGQLTIPVHVSPAARHLLENMLAVNPAKRYSFEQIRRHEWFQMVRPMLVRGLAKGERVPVDEETMKKMGRLGLPGFNVSKVKFALGKDERNRETATYWLLVKKAVREGRKISCYFGGNHFDSKLIDVSKPQEEKFQGEDTESFGEVEGISIVVPQAPIGCEDVQGSPNPNGQPFDFLQLPNNADVSFTSSRQSVASWVFSGIMTQMDVHDRQEDFHPMDSPSKRSKRKINNYATQRKEAEFYENNPDHRLARVDLQSNEQTDPVCKTKQAVQTSTKRRLRLKSESIPKNQLVTGRREKTEAVRNKASLKKSTKQEYAVRISPPKQPHSPKKHSQPKTLTKIATLLPYLASVKLEQLRSNKLPFLHHHSTRQPK